MKRSPIDIAASLARLSALTTFELRGEWRRHCRMSPPMRLSRDLLMRGITYTLQERMYGALPKASLRKLDRASVEAFSREQGTSPSRITLKPGTRLVREWRGVTHTVLVYATASNGTASVTSL